MTGGYICFYKGIPINIKKTINKYKNTNILEIKEFEDYIKTFGYKNKYSSNLNNDFKPKILMLRSNDDYEDNLDENCAFFILDYWTVQSWCSSVSPFGEGHLLKISEFFKINQTEQTKFDELVKMHQDKLIFDNTKLIIESINCEFYDTFEKK